MRILLASDFHMDINDKTPDTAPADILVIAGDLCQSNSFAKHMPQWCDRYPHVVYVPGNHDFYQATYEETLDRLRNTAAKIPNLYVLYNETATIGEQRFVGTTLWFPNVDPMLGVRFSDFSWIKCLNDWYREENAAAQEYLAKAIKQGDIVVTHHAPSEKSVNVMYKHDRGNVFYVSDMTSVIEQTQPAIWHHGHMHIPTEYRIGNTRVICNPYGYMSRSETKYFDAAKIIEV
jgi:Icc-related predicted phosphoesterase